MAQAILVVDDDGDIGEWVAFLLSGYGYDVRYASNGWAALEMLAQPPLDLLLTDLMMPRLSGADFVRKMRDREELATTPVLMMSSMPEEIVRGECPTITAYLGKPFSTAELLEAISKIIGGPPSRGHLGLEDPQ